MNRRRFLLYLTAAATLPWSAHAAAVPRAVAEVDRSITFGTINIRAYIDVPVDTRVAWSVLTDYERLDQFVPDLHQSKLISRPGEPARVYQRGMKSLLMVDTPIEVVLQMDEHPPGQIRFRLITGNLKDMYGQWDIMPYSGGVRVHYRTRMEPGLLAPRVPGDWMLIQTDIEGMLGAIGKEMLRRQGYYGQR